MKLIRPQSNGILFLTGAFTLARTSVISASFEQPVGLLAKMGLQGWFSPIWYGVFVAALAFLFWYSGIKRCSAYTAAAFSGMMPFTALLLLVLI